jgi:serine/threonine protein kinase
LQLSAHVLPINEEYIIGKELGRGRFSVVHECVHKATGLHAAVKIINKSTVKPDEKALLRTEIAVLKLMDHPHIIKMLNLYESRDTIYIVMEMLKGGELFERIVGRPRFTEVEAAKLLRPLLESVAYMHDLGIVHRDIKPENILCGENLSDLKIADFGLSKMILPKEKMTQPCGTLSYVAPEVLTNQGYGKEADLWSIGVIMFLLICGKLPFDGASADEIIQATVQGDLKVNPHVWGKLSEPAKHLLRSLLNKSATERLTAREALKHPFVQLNAPREKHHHHHHHHHHKTGKASSENAAAAGSGSSRGGGGGGGGGESRPTSPGSPPQEEKAEKEGAAASAPSPTATPRLNE